MLQYLVAGLVLGGIYAIAATGLVITYQSAGVLNFAFGAIAFTVARFYYFLNTEHTWPILPAALLSILGLGPVLGLLLYGVVFRHLRVCSTLVKVLATIGVSVALPSIDTLVFGNGTILQAPGLAPQPVRTFDFLGVPVTLDQVIVYICVVVLMLGGFVILRYTEVGLRIRALVDSPAMTALSGTNPGRISTAVWAVSSTLAGLVGILVAPINGLDPGQMSLLMVAAFAGVIAGRLRSIPITAVVGMAMGIASALVQYGLPPASIYTADLLYSIPFITMVLFLAYFILRHGTVAEVTGVGGNLDRAIRTQAAQTATAINKAGLDTLSWRPSALAFALLLGLPYVLHGLWIGLLAEGIAYAIIFLSFSLATGEGGMIWLCQATFACAGGMTAALLAVHDGVPILLGVTIGGFVAVPFGLMIGWLTIRMGDLYVALVTLSFGLIVENVVFNRAIFSNNGLGINVNPPQFAAGGRALVYLAIAVFAIIALIIVNLRRSTTGLALAAVRSTNAAAQSTGISVVRMKLFAAGVGAFVAGIGGGVLAITLSSANTANYSTLEAEVWLVVLVTQGIRSNGAALIAGLSQTVILGVSQIYLPHYFANFAAVAFGLGAIALIKFPEGVLTMQARQIRSALERLRIAMPAVYRSFRVVGTTYLVTFVVLVVTVSHLWWLWLLVTVAVANIGGGLLFAALNRSKPTKVNVATGATAGAYEPV